MTHPTPRVAARPLRRCAHALALPVCLSLCLSLSGCFTLGLWGFDYTYKDGRSSWEFDETSWEGPDHLPWYGRLFLTPFTLAADCLTLCIQYWLFADDDDCDRPPPRRRGRAC